MTEQQLLDRMAQMIRVGFVNARQPEKMRVKVTLPDTTGSPLITNWLPVLCPRACADMQYDLPDVGDQVLCLFLAYGLEQGFVIGSMYGRQTPPVQSGDKWHRTFSDGATIEYDRARHALNAVIPGTATIKCDGALTLEAPIIYARGTFVNTAKDGSPGKATISGGMEVTNGGIAVPNGDVQASGVSLTSHTTDGVEPGSGTSSHPTGGTTDSPGTAAIPLPDVGTAAYAALVATQLATLHEEVENGDKPSKDYDRLILCLPDIARAMADKVSGDQNKQGWLYLASFLDRWLSGVANSDPDKGGKPFEVAWSWLEKCDRAHEAIKAINKNLFTENAQKLLLQRLQRDGKLKNKRCEFNYIQPDKKVNGKEVPEWLQWNKDYYQSQPVDSQKLPDFNEYGSIVDGLQAAMGSFMIYALARGYTEPDTNRHKIVIQEVGLVAYDSFNFDGDDFYFYWRCEPPNFIVDWVPGYTGLTNEHFQTFRGAYARGNDFLVISGPKSVALDKEHEYYAPL